MAAIIAAAIAGTAAIAGGAMSAGAAKDAAAASSKASKSTVAESARQYDQTRKDNEPWRLAGQQALSRLSDPSQVLNNFQASPDYQFRLGQGLESVTQNKAVNGLLKSGSALKGLNDYAQNTASSEFGNWWNRQAGLAGVGQAANAANQQAGQYAVGVNAQANQWNAANQMASSYNQANAWGQAVGQVGGIAANVVNNYGSPSSGSLSGNQNALYRGYGG